jgi:hypothetical protein
MEPNLGSVGAGINDVVSRVLQAVRGLIAQLLYPFRPRRPASAAA